MYTPEESKRSKTNASIISLIQRMVDITSIFLTGYIISYYTGMSFYYKPLIFCFMSLSIFQLVGGVTDFYRSWRGVSFITELKITMQNWAVTIGIATCISVFISNFNFKVDFYFSWLLIFVAISSILRLMLRITSGFFRSKGYNKKIVAVAGDMKAGKDLLDVFNKQKWLGFDVYGYYSDLNVNRDSYYQGGYENLIQDAREGKVERVYLAFNMEDVKKLDWVIRSLADTTCSVMLIPDIFTYNILHSRFEEIDGIPMVSIFETPLSGLNRLIKRIEDLLLSIVILVLISPIMICIAILVKLTSRGPIFFKQTRYGIDGKSIKVYKFRTMKVMEDGGKVTQATKNDPRVTKFGRFLRKSSLDELPQFLNVLHGSMSIVGPRPHAVSHNEEYRSKINGYMLRHKVKPGITGWAQINGWRGETDTLEKMEKRIDFDLFYIRKWSLYFDVKIIFLTVVKGFFGKTVY